MERSHPPARFASMDATVAPASSALTSAWFGGGLRTSRPSGVVSRGGVAKRFTRQRIHGGSLRVG